MKVRILSINLICDEESESMKDGKAVYEMARIIEEYANKIEKEGKIEDEEVLKDVNDLTVGRITYDEC